MMKVLENVSPPKVSGRPTIYPFDRLKVNGAIRVGKYSKGKQASVKTAAEQWAVRQGIEATFTTRNENGTLLIYRTK